MALTAAAETNSFGPFGILECRKHPWWFWAGQLQLPLASLGRLDATKETGVLIISNSAVRDSESELVTSRE